MQFHKSSFVLFLISSYVYATAFTSQDCLRSNYQTEIIHKGELFGLLKHEFRINKERCLIKVEKKRVLGKSWVIDVCREPIHIKVEDKGSLTVHKRNGACSVQEAPDSYCEELAEILEGMQDDGLIFAKGERDNLSSSHGQVYCSYLLAKNYLQSGLVFSPNKADINIFEAKKESCGTGAVESKNAQPNQAEQTNEIKKTGSF